MVHLKYESDNANCSLTFIQINTVGSSSSHPEIHQPRVCTNRRRSDTYWFHMRPDKNLHFFSVTRCNIIRDDINILIRKMACLADNKKKKGHVVNIQTMSTIARKIGVSL